MKRAGSDRLLNWGFAAALALHAMALAGAAALPTQVAKEDMPQITVFDAAAPTAPTPVELVSWPPADPQPTQVLIAPHPEPTGPVVAIAPRQAPPQPNPATARVQPPKTHQSRPAAPKAEPGEGGGGGGGFVDPGSPSSAGDLPGTPGGSTPLGDVPGTGSGAGSGTGGGAGSGVGGGRGFGAGPGQESGSGGGTGEGGDPGFVSRVADRKEPVVVFKGNLVYPASAVEDGVEGVVRLEVLVTEEGLVSEAKVAASSRDRRLDAAALEFVKSWRYKPAAQDGKPRSVWTHAAVTFELK